MIEGQSLTSCKTGIPVPPNRVPNASSENFQDVLHLLQNLVQVCPALFQALHQLFHPCARPRGLALGHDFGFALLQFAQLLLFCALPPVILSNSCKCMLQAAKVGGLVPAVCFAASEI
eukprot:1158757-Pelagomonas_calceolata.AAC.3